MNLQNEHDIQNSEELLRVAVVEMRDVSGETLCIAMGEDGTDMVGYGLTSEEAVQNLEEKLLDIDDEDFDWDVIPNEKLVS